MAAGVRALMQRGRGVVVFAAAGLAAAILLSEAEAAEADIRGFSFECATPDGREVKPVHGDIEGEVYTDLPAQREQCLGSVDRKIALCRENTRFATEAADRRHADCLAVFRARSRACVDHFSFERSRCWFEDSAAAGDSAGERSDEAGLETAPGGRHRVEPANRVMKARRAANVRTGPGPQYDIVGTLLAGDEVQVTGEVRGLDWLRVAFPRSGDLAFIYAPLLSALPAPTRAAPETEARLELAGVSWSITANQSCAVWNYGNPGYEPLTWSGACTEGKATGEGRLVFRAGEGVYEGGMLEGKLHGRGVLEWSDGFRYEGELRDGKQHGQGTLTQANGERYAGAWRNGRPYGRGTYTQTDGTTFDGDWRDGCFGERSGRWASVGTTAAACGFD